MTTSRLPPMAHDPLGRLTRLQEEWVILHRDPLDVDRPITDDEVIAAKEYDRGSGRTEMLASGDFVESRLAEDWLTNVVRVASALWPECPENADSNVRDAYWLARCVVDQTRIVLPTEVVSVSRGVAVVECVEKHYINLAEADRVVREIETGTVAERCRNLLGAIWQHGLLPFQDEVEATPYRDPRPLAVALFTWYGCISLGKVLRATARSPEDVPGQPPTFVPIQQVQRWKGYAFLSALAEEEAQQGNPWIRFGMTCTRLFERHRHNLTVDWWLPGDSPYWEG